jgi:hypothetical protein
MPTGEAFGRSLRSNRPAETGLPLQGDPRRKRDKDNDLRTERMRLQTFSGDKE